MEIGDFLGINCSRSKKNWPLLYFLKDFDAGNVYILDLDWVPTLHASFYSSWKTIYRKAGLPFTPYIWH